MRARFAHALNNRFILIDYQNQKPSLSFQDWLKLAQKAEKSFDQLIEIHTQNVSKASLRFFNRDGSEAEACGNGSRCVALWFYEQGESKIDFLTPGGLISAQTKSPEEISLTFPPPKILSQGAGSVNQDRIDVGNPHCVVWLDELKDEDLRIQGPLLENAVPGRQNVNFAQRINEEEILLKVWERGVGFTEACGTGACATHVSARIRGYVKETSTLHQAGGILRVTWAGVGKPLTLIGSACLEELIEV